MDAVENTGPASPLEALATRLVAIPRGPGRPPRSGTPPTAPGPAQAAARGPPPAETPAEPEFDWGDLPEDEGAVLIASGVAIGFRGFKLDRSMTPMYCLCSRTRSLS